MNKGLTVSAGMDLASGLKNFWYPVDFCKNLKPGKSRPFELFDSYWVLFQNEQGEIGCIQDACAHRACPLSLGKVTKGRLQCPYHGWEYTIEGNCEYMPSCHPTPTSVASLPVVAQAGMIWVWPGEEPAGTLLEQPLHAPQNFELQAEIIMDLDVEHGLMLENLLDLAHAPFTHGGTFAKGWSVPNLVHFTSLPHNPAVGRWDPYPIEMAFEPPCYVISTIGLRGQDCGRHLHQVHACLPRGIGKTRLLYRISLDFFKWIHRIPGNYWLWSHLAQRVIHEDIRLVKGQQERLQAGGNVWNKPVSYDKLGVRYRLWRNQVEQAR